jgi:hypothetical protein
MNSQPPAPPLVRDRHISHPPGKRKGRSLLLWFATPVLLGTAIYAMHWLAQIPGGAPLTAAAETDTPCVGGVASYMRKRRTTGGELKGDFKTKVPGLESQLEASSQDLSDVEQIFEQDPAAKKAHQLCEGLCRAWAKSQGAEREGFYDDFRRCLRNAWEATGGSGKGDAAVTEPRPLASGVASAAHVERRPPPPAPPPAHETCDTEATAASISRSLPKTGVPGPHAPNAVLIIEIVSGEVRHVTSSDEVIGKTAASALMGAKVAQGNCTVRYRWTL